MTKSLFQSEAAWRYIDAYFPRIFGMLFHTYLLSQYGGEMYALPGWILSILGLCMALVPDPHSYILVRANGSRARRLLSLTIPSLLFKATSSAAIVFVAMCVLPTAHIVNAYGAAWPTLFAATVLYSSVEYLWATLGTISLATGDVKRVAQWGMGARATAIIAIGTSWLFGRPSMAIDFMLATSPVLLVWMFLIPWRYAPRRSWQFFMFSLRAYAGWNQGIALATNAMFQMPLLILGISPNTDATVVGQIAYVSRFLLAVLQPFQILQSIVIRNVAQIKRGILVSNDKKLKFIFRIGSIALISMGSMIMIATTKAKALDPETTILVITMIAGVAVSVWTRYEMAQLLASPNIKSLFILAYLPVVVITFLMSMLAIYMGGKMFLAFFILVGWVVLSLSWKWVGIVEDKIKNRFHRKSQQISSSYK